MKNCVIPTPYIEWDNSFLSENAIAEPGIEAMDSTQSDWTFEVK